MTKKTQTNYLANISHYNKATKTVRNTKGGLSDVVGSIRNLNWEMNYLSHKDFSTYIDDFSKVKEDNSSEK